MRLALLLAALWAPTAVPASPPCADGLSIPARLASARGGDAVRRLLRGMSRAERELAIRAEVLSGNVPRFLRRLVPVVLSGPGVGGQPVEVTVCVSPDYLAVGSDRDFFLVPVALGTALDVARRFGSVLPTRKLVDAIYAQAAVRLRPQPLAPGKEMRSTAYYWRHNELVRRQRREGGARLGALTAGDKKDLVLSRRLAERPGRVAIYGWHRREGDPIQPLSTAHDLGYADYSHGVRLVSAIAYVDGVPRTLLDLLADPDLSGLLSDEGPLPNGAELLRLGSPPLSFFMGSGATGPLAWSFVLSDRSR